MFLLVIFTLRTLRRRGWHWIHSLSFQSKTLTRVPNLLWNEVFSEVKSSFQIDLNFSHLQTQTCSRPPWPQSQHRWPRFGRIFFSWFISQPLYRVQLTLWSAVFLRHPTFQAFYMHFGILNRKQAKGKSCIFLPILLRINFFVFFNLFYDILTTHRYFSDTFQKRMNFFGVLDLISLYVVKKAYGHGPSTCISMQ